MADSIVQNSFFWNGTQSYGQEELDAVFYASIRNGVNIYDDGTMGGQVTKGIGQVTVAPFIAHVDGAWYYNQTDKALTIDAENSSLTRIDRVVVTADFSARETRLEILKGTASANPAAPALTQNHWVKWQISLARVTVTANGITAVADERTDTKLCGGIRMRGVSEFDTYFNHIKNDYETWYAQAQGDTGKRQIYVQTTAPTSSDVTDGAFWIQTGTDGKAFTFNIRSSGKWQTLSPNTLASLISVTDRWNKATRTLSDCVPTMVLGVYQGSDQWLKPGEYHAVKFKNPRAIDGMAMDAGYAYYQDGIVHIRKAGVYRVDGSLHLRNLYRANAVHVGLRNHGATNVAENYGYPDPAGHLCTASFSGLVRLHDNDTCSIYLCYSGDRNMMIMNGKQAPTQLTVTPVYFIDE